MHSINERKEHKCDSELVYKRFEFWTATKFIGGGVVSCQR